MFPLLIHHTAKAIATKSVAPPPNKSLRPLPIQKLVFILKGEKERKRERVSDRGQEGGKGGGGKVRQKKGGEGGIEGMKGD